SGTIQKLCARPNNLPALEELQFALGPELRSVFKPALLARMIVVPYYPLGDNVLRQIVELKLEKIGKRLGEQHRIAFGYSEALVEHIVERCVEVENGARNVDHILTGALLPEISRRVLGAAAAQGRFHRIFVDVGGAGGLRYSVE
ncbi:MAG: type VI secretion system ATPase TssH, partial [Acidobacteriota bacterium]|nr:type VI secretion system ATPase TssH [Acidobacteriota bacterium]